MSLVEVVHLSRSFGPIKAVRDVSFAFDAGQIYGFIGPNGSGKSTTMRILASLDLPSDGDCFINGLSTVDDADNVRRLIGYMPDSYGSYPDMTVLDYLDFFARAYEMPSQARQSAVAGVVEFCQLGGLKHKLITTLSKGMKQRLCLGRCLIHDPQVLILDEPSAGLDPRARIEFRDLLRLLAQQGKAIFISSHILSELEEMCDAVAIIEQGQLVAEGSVAKVKAEAREVRDQRAAAIAEEAGTELEQRIEVVMTQPHQAIERLLLEQPGVAGLRLEHDHALFNFVGDQQAQADLLRALVLAEVPVCRFRSRDDNLEDVFLNLTEGKVQ